MSDLADVVINETKQEEMESVFSIDVHMLD